MKILVATTMYPNKYRTFSGIFIQKHVSILHENFGIECLLATGGGSNSSIILIIKKYFVLWCQIIWNLATKKVSLIHAHYSYPTGFFAWIGKCISGKILIITTHGSDIHDHNNRNFIAQYLNRIVLHSSDHIIAVSHELKNAITESFGISEEKISVIDMGVDSSIFFPNNKIPKKETFTLLFVGRLSEEKGFDVLLDAFEILSKNNSSSIKCIVIGDGDQQSHYKKSVKSRMLTDNVTFMGSQNQTRISEWMNQSHLVVIPSRKEGFGLVAIEALACGTPVICSNVGGLKEIVENGKNGFLFPVEQKDELVERIERFIQNPETILPDNCVQSVKKFDVLEKVKQIYSVYSNMVNG